ncbi:hypothetical protein BHE74_00020348, partial [Ensete ventricosum]
ESAQRDSGSEYKRDPTQAVRSQRVLMLSLGCHFDSGSSADLAELSLQDKTFTRGGPYDDQVIVGEVLIPPPNYFAVFPYSAHRFSAVAAIFSSSPAPATLTLLAFIASLSPPIVSRVGRMSFASSHSESRSIKISARRSRVLSCPSGASVSVAIVPLSSAPGQLQDR